MTETYRPGDIAMVTGQHRLASPAIYTARGGRLVIWAWLDGAYTINPVEVGPVLGNVADIARLADGPSPEAEGVSAEQRYVNLMSNASDVLTERDRLARWKKEAMPVMDGLQELGKALRIPLGQRITGPAALEAVQQLRDAAQAIVTTYDDQDHWFPHEELEKLREVLNR